MANLAIIPARGGSKRIPKKNIKDFLGKPIIAYSIEEAIKSDLFDEVMVSTDDIDIATVARSYGASVPFLRGKENADDFATTLDVLKEVERNYLELNKTFDLICCLYPTAPFITSEKLSEGRSLLINESFDVVFPVVAFSYPIWRGVEITAGKTQMVWPEHINHRSQDLRPVYHDAGQWYWYNPKNVGKSLFTDNTGSIVLKEEEVQDIDTYSDWVLAEMKYNMRHEK